MDVIKSLWKDKPLFIAAVVGLVAVVYILYKKSQGTSNISSDSSNPDGLDSSTTGLITPMAGGGGRGTYVEEYTNTPTTYNITATLPPVASTSAPVASPVPAKNNSFATVNIPPMVVTSSKAKSNSAKPLNKPTSKPKTTSSKSTNSKSQSIPKPAPKNTPGHSNNYWVYTANGNETLQDVMVRYGGNNSFQFYQDYRNNAAIFKAAGLYNPSSQTFTSKKLPKGLQFSL